jgi:hypothetical protein
MPFLSLKSFRLANVRLILKAPFIWELSATGQLWVPFMVHHYNKPIHDLFHGCNQEMVSQTFNNAHPIEGMASHLQIDQKCQVNP